MLLEHYPCLMVDADKASREGQKWYKRVTKFDLVALVVGAGLGALAPSASSDLRKWIGIGVAILLVFGLVARIIVWERKYDKQWFGGRAVAETAKSLSWRYMMKVEPFDTANADQEFLLHLGEVRNASSEALSAAVDVSVRGQQITDEMRRIRRLSIAGRRDIYIADRLDDQVTWYTSKTNESKHKSDRWFWVSMGSQASAVVCAILLASNVLAEMNLIGVFSSLGSAATAWLQLGRHDELRRSYHLAADELITIRDLAENAATESELSDAVRDGEGAISREHTMWMAKRGESAPV